MKVELDRRRVYRWFKQRRSKGLPDGFGEPKSEIAKPAKDDHRRRQSDLISETDGSDEDLAPIHTPRLESDSDCSSKYPAVKEEVNTDEDEKNEELESNSATISPLKNRKNGIDRDGTLSRFFDRNPYPNRSHRLDLGKFSSNIKCSN